jgi:hypothetical protein
VGTVGTVGTVGAVGTVGTVGTVGAVGVLALGFFAPSINKALQHTKQSTKFQQTQRFVLVGRKYLLFRRVSGSRWIELAQDRVQWWVLVLAVLKLCVLLPENQLISEMDLREIGCGDGRWIELAEDRVL